LIIEREKWPAPTSAGTAADCGGRDLVYSSDSFGIVFGVGDRVSEAGRDCSGTSFVAEDEGDAVSVTAEDVEGGGVDSSS
jgi:hypothetical protein